MSDQTNWTTICPHCGYESEDRAMCQSCGRLMDESVPLRPFSASELVAKVVESWQPCSDVEALSPIKEEPEFWGRLEQMLSYDKQRTLLVDGSEGVLLAAKQYGLAHLLFVARPSSRQKIEYSCHFPSIVYFKELLPL